MKFYQRRQWTACGGVEVLLQSLLIWSLEGGGGVSGDLHYLTPLSRGKRSRNPLDMRQQCHLEQHKETSRPYLNLCMDRDIPAVCSPLNYIDP